MKSIDQQIKELKDQIKELEAKKDIKVGNCYKEGEYYYKILKLSEDYSMETYAWCQKDGKSISSEQYNYMTTLDELEPITLEEFNQAAKQTIENINKELGL